MHRFSNAIYDNNESEAITDIGAGPHMSSNELYVEDMYSLAGEDLVAVNLLTLQSSIPGIYSSLYSIDHIPEIKDDDVSGSDIPQDK